MPYEEDFTLVGTTDADHAGPLEDVQASEDEIAYLIAAFTRHFALPLARGDVLHQFAGVRALVDDGTGKPEAATRGYRITQSDPAAGAPLLGIWGGKITSYRAVAQGAVDLLAARLPALSGPAWTADAALPGGDFPREEQAGQTARLAALYPFLSPQEALRITRAYGTCAADWLGSARSRAALGRDFGHGLSEAEVAYLHREEWAASADDILWRRSKLGLRFTAAQVATLEDWLQAAN